MPRRKPIRWKIFHKGSTRVLLADLHGPISLAQLPKVWGDRSMSSAAEVLALRRDRTSSVEVLLATLKWEQATEEAFRSIMRSHDVKQAADRVPLNVAVPAADAQRMWGEGGAVTTPVKRALRSRKRISRGLRGGHATRQLNFAAFYS